MIATGYRYCCPDVSFLGLLSPGGLVVVERTGLSKDIQDFEGQGLETIFLENTGPPCWRYLHPLTRS